MSDIPLLPSPLVIKRHYRWRGDYHYVDDYFASVEAESCLTCGRRGDDPSMPSVGCPIATKAIEAYETADTDTPTEMAEWEEVEPGRIRCRAWTDRPPLDGQDVLPVTEDADGLTCDICGAELADWPAADEHVEQHEGWAA